MEDLYKVLQKAGFNTGVPSGNYKGYEEGEVEIDNLVIGIYNPSKNDKPMAECNISLFKTNSMSKELQRVSLIDGKVAIKEGNISEYRDILTSLNIEHKATDDYISVDQEANSSHQEGNLQVLGYGTKITISIPQVME